MPLRPLASIVQAVVANAAKDRDALIKAHREAAAFHEAMAEALDAQDDVERYAFNARADKSGDTFWSNERAESEKRYQENVDKAAVALQKMPVTWSAVLNATVTATPVQAAE